MSDQASDPPQRENRFWPLSSRARWILVIVTAVTLLHLGLRWQVVENPPYWDAAAAVYPEALWLVDHDFDYVRLLTQEKNFEQGGPATYVWSVLPGCLGLLVLAVPSPQSQFVILHLLQFVLAGVLAAMIFLVVQAEGRVSKWLAGAVALLTLCHPIMGAQIDQITMELIVCVGIMVVALAAYRERFVLAGLLGVLALFLKESSVIICLAVIGLAVFTLVARGASWRRWLLVMAVVCAPLLVVHVAETIMANYGQFARSADLSIAGGYASIVETITQAPLLYPMSLLALLLVPVALWRQGIFGIWRESGFRAAAQTCLDRPDIRLYAVATATMFVWFAVHLIRGQLLIRYLVWCMPWFFILITLTLLLLKLPKPVIWTCLAVMLTFQLSNQYGRWLPDIELDESRGGHVRERSREVCADIELSREVVAWLEENAGDRPVLVTAPFDRMMNDPRIGYVQRKLNLYSANYGYVPNAPSFLNLTPAGYHEAYILHYPSVYVYPDPMLYSPGGRPVMVKRFADMPSPVFIYSMRQADPPPEPLPPTLRSYWPYGDVDDPAEQKR